MIDTEKLVIRSIYTYKELCTLFGETTKSSDSKAAQLKEWARYFRWSNPTRRKFQIEEIYDYPHEKIDRRRKNGGKCTSKYLALDDVLMEYFKKEHCIENTVSGILAAAGLLTNFYIKNRYVHVDYINSGLSEGIVNNVFWKMENVINAGKASLERLRKEGFLSVAAKIRLIKTDGSCMHLSVPQSSIVDDILVQIRKEMSLQPNDLFKPDIRKQYNEKVIEQLNMEFHTQVKYWYRVYDVRLANDMYISKTAEDISALTRKFVKSICLSMQRIDYAGGFYQKTESAAQIIEVISKQFKHMSYENWEICFSEIPKEMNQQDQLFFLGYYTSYESLRKEKPELLKEPVESVQTDEIVKNTFETNGIDDLCRAIVMDELGSDRTQEIEYIIPGINWENVLNGYPGHEDLPNYYDMLLNAYYDALDNVRYVRTREQQKQIIEEYVNGKIKDYYSEHKEKLYTLDMDSEWTMPTELEATLEPYNDDGPK